MERDWESKLLKWFLGFLFVAFLINIGTLVLIHEEPRRGIITFEMLKTHNFLQPTVLGVPYFKKPPLHEWITSLFSVIAGSVCEVSLRLPSAVAVIATAALIYLLGKKFVGKRGALFGALIYPTFFMVLVGYGTKCEPDTLFTLFNAAAVLSWLYLFEAGRRYAAWTAGYFFTSLALLTKGLPALAFFLLMPATYALLRKEPRVFLSKEHLVGAAVGLTPFLLWVASVNREKAIETLLAEVTARAPEHFSALKALKRYLSYPFRLLAATLPWSAMLLWAWRKRGLKGEEFYPKLFLTWFAVNGVIYWLFPGTRLRYLMPALPVLALYGGWLLSESKVLHKRAKEILKFTAQVIVLVGIVAGVVATKNPSLTLQCTVTFLIFLYALYFLFIPRFNFTYTVILVASLMLILRGFYSSYYYPIAQFKYPPVREVAAQIVKDSAGYPLFTKTTYLQLCFYVERGRNELLRFTEHPPKESLFLSQRPEGHVLREYRLGRHRFFLCSYSIGSLKPQQSGEGKRRQTPEKRSRSGQKGESLRG
ncbi:ArnT family glycosyltransferase [Thermovibrio ammonificans]